MRFRPHRLSVVARVFAWSLVLTVAASAHAEEPLPPPAPPLTRSLYLLDVPFLHFGALERVSASTRPGFDVEIGYANTFSHSWHPNAIKVEFETLGRPFTRAEAEELHLRHSEDAIFFIDGEVTRVALRGSLRLDDALSVALEVPYISFSALHLDSGIESFHKAFGFADSERENFPRGRFQIVRQRPHGPLEFEDQTPSSGLGDATASLRFRREIGPRTSVGADLSLKLPTGSAGNYRGSGSLDAGLLAGVEHRLGATARYALRLETAVVVPGRFRGDTANTLEASTFLRVMAAAQARLGAKTFVSVAGVLEQSPFRTDTIPDEARSAVDVVLGVTRRLSESSSVRLSIDENLSKLGDAADVTVALGFAFRP